MLVGVLEDVVGRLLNHTPMTNTVERYALPPLVSDVRQFGLNTILKQKQFRNLTSDGKVDVLRDFANQIGQLEFI